MDEEIRCPECETLDVEEIVSDESRSYGGHPYVCNVCGHEFEESEGLHVLRS